MAYILTSEGKIAEGVPMADYQVALRLEIAAALHAQLCNHARLEDYVHVDGYSPCQRAADKLILRYAMVRIDGPDLEVRGKIYVPPEPPPSWLRGPIERAKGKAS